MAVSIPAMYDPKLRQLVFPSRTKVDAQHLVPLEQVRVIRKNVAKVDYLEIVGMQPACTVLLIFKVLTHYFGYIRPRVRALLKHTIVSSTFFTSSCGRAAVSPLIGPHIISSRQTMDRRLPETGLLS